MTETNEYVSSRAKRQSFSDRATAQAREKMYARLAALVALDEQQSILDVGVTADRELVSSNFFENRYPYPQRITALSDQDASWMEEHYQGLRFVQSSALEMPFPDNSFDLVFSNAVIEHVGNGENQQQFLRECARVARRFVFITTPNRYHPVEFHTVLPFIHWLPKPVHRKLLRALGMDYFAREETLNLLSRHELLGLAKASWENLPDSAIRLTSIRFLGFSSNLLLFARKP
ncbi:hypothetical protein AGMMS49543_08570 [Betaproteobacteria bacterium]|nr:hypothetical protein AGMMS49543_08570 [Betaproteobacteria bacterium]